jgi:iron complex transport system substrate-binding protein
MYKIRRGLGFFGLTLLAIVLFSACANNISQTLNNSAEGILSQCRMVKHSMGETCVSEHPKRIVAVSGHAVDAVFSLGLDPVGVNSNISASWAKETQNIVLLGKSGQVNLEKILTLQPDLILGSDWDLKDYNLLNAIAPTVLGDAKGSWQDEFTFYAKALGKTQQAEQLMAQYQQRVQKLQAQLQGKQQQIEVSLVRVYSDNRLGLYLKNSFAGTILSDIGFARPSFQNKGEIGKAPFQIVVNNEIMQAADGDAIFTWSFGATSQIAQSAKDSLHQLQADPLWQTLNAVQQNRVYPVGDHWHVASTPTQAMWVIDDLEKHLLNPILQK